MPLHRTDPHDPATRLTDPSPRRGGAPPRVWVLHPWRTTAAGARAADPRHATFVRTAAAADGLDFTVASF